MKKINYVLITAAAICLLFAANLPAQTLSQPLKNVQIRARVTLDAEGVYHYFYTVSNPAANQLGVYETGIDITLTNNGNNPGAIDVAGYTGPDYFTPQLAMKRGVLYIPVEWKKTSLWLGGVSYQDGRWSLIGDAQVMLWHPKYDFNTNFQALINPGQTSPELETISYGLPGIRKVVFKPKFTLLSFPPGWLQNEEEGGNEAMVANNIKIESLGYLGTIIGPTAPPAYNPLQFNLMMQDYVTQSVNLGWLKDATLTQQLNTYLSQNSIALKENRLVDAQNIVTQFMNAVQNSTLTQRTSEAYALLYYNAKFFFQKISEEIPVTVEISPSKGEHFLNEEHTTQARAMQGYQPMEDYYLTARVISGPNTGLVWRGSSDAGGNWSFSYKSEKLGIDIIIFAVELAEIISSDTILWQPSQIIQSAPIKVTWKGGPDLMLNKFFPPMIKIPFAKPNIPLEESTINVGNSPAPASVTRYYMTKNEQMSPDDIVIGERQVPPLAVKEISEYKANIPVPSNLEPGNYYVYGCADANKQIIELSETNNCRTLTVQVYVPVESSGNRSPDCTQAKATPDKLWPPNHKYQKISIVGVTDPDKDKVTINVNYITQDEPVNGLGDGDTSPDATMNPLQVRAERSGTGNGRVYHIGFTASDGKGGKCEGEVTVCVPHDQGQGKVCIDDGPQYDSTKP